MNFRETAADLECLKQGVIEIRSNLSENAAKTAIDKCTALGMEIERRQSDVRGCSKNEQQTPDLQRKKKFFES